MVEQVHDLELAMETVISLTCACVCVKDTQGSGEQDQHGR